VAVVVLEYVELFGYVALNFADRKHWIVENVVSALNNVLLLTSKLVLTSFPSRILVGNPDHFKVETRRVKLHMYVW
jgi:hypothetical protein